MENSVNESIPVTGSCAALTAAAPDNQLLLVDEQKMVDVEKPHNNDVLCGRGVTTNRHPGNESFRRLVGKQLTEKNRNV